MADFRSIKTAMWREDDWFMDLPTEGKLLWIYLFSNPSASVAGIYRLSLRTMVNETGLDLERISDLLDLFARSNKAHFADGVMWVVKMREHQETISPKLQAKIKKDISLIPKASTVYGMYARKYGIDTVSIPIPTIQTRDRHDTETETQRAEDVNPEKDLPTLAPSSSVESGLSLAVKAYESHIGIISYSVGSELKDLSATYPPAWLPKAIELAKGKRSPMPYIRSCLRNWQNGDGEPPVNGAAPKQKQKLLMGIPEVLP